MTTQDSSLSYLTRRVFPAIALVFAASLVHAQDAPVDSKPATEEPSAEQTVQELVEQVTEPAPQEQDEEPVAAPQAADAENVAGATSMPAEEEWLERAELLIEQKFKFVKDSEDADELFLKLDKILHERIHRINERMLTASAPTQTVDLGQGQPVATMTIAELHEKIGEMYQARLLLLEHITDELRLEVTATDVIGVDQLAMETEYIWEQLHFRALNLPAAFDNLLRRIEIAPLPVIWRVIQFLLVIAVFRWWRKWFPETMRRMLSSLSDIRPRSPAVMRRIRIIWYVEQIRRPIEWMLFSTVLFAMFEMSGINLLLSILETVVWWVLLGWLAVAILNAFAARGAAGLTGADESVRLRSLRLVAAWLVLLGLGLSLAEDLAGVATIHAWVWRMFQLLALPVLLILLAWWRRPIFTRLERESEGSETVQKMLQHQRGLRSFGSAANGALWLFANNMRRKLMRAMLRVGDGQGISLTGAPTSNGVEADVDGQIGVAAEVLPSLLSGKTGFDKHARTERRQLIRRASSDQAGIVAVIGERGLGKSALLHELTDALPDVVIRLDCSSGSFADLEEALRQQLSINKVSADSVSEAMRAAGIKIVTVKNVHRLSRPIAGGQVELKKLTDLIEAIDYKILWVMSIDSFAWQFLRRVRADQSNIHDSVEVPFWTEDQLSMLLDMRTEEADLQPDFSRVQVPSEHAVTSYDTAEERNKAGVYRMIWTLSGGNPEVALLTWAHCLYREEGGEQVYVRLPMQPNTRELESAAHNVLLVLRCIAQSELITEEDIVDNLRLPHGAVGTAMHYCVSRGWIKENDGRFRLSMRWFRVITRTLARQNLLAR